jgi:hypothetical protein
LLLKGKLQNVPFLLILKKINIKSGKETFLYPKELIHLQTFKKKQKSWIENKMGLIGIDRKAGRSV